MNDERRRLHITQQVLKVLADDKCTVAEAVEILDDVKRVVLLTAPVCSDWPEAQSGD